MESAAALLPELMCVEGWATLVMIQLPGTHKDPTALHTSMCKYVGSRDLFSYGMRAVEVASISPAHKNKHLVQ